VGWLDGRTRLGRLVTIWPRIRDGLRSEPTHQPGTIELDGLRGLIVSSVHDEHHEHQPTTDRRPPRDDPLLQDPPHPGRPTRRPRPHRNQRPMIVHYTHTITLCVLQATWTYRMLDLRVTNPPRSTPTRSNPAPSETDHTKRTMPTRARREGSPPRRSGGRPRLRSRSCPIVRFGAWSRRPGASPLTGPRGHGKQDV
jgi:hypothetical protein